MCKNLDEATSREWLETNGIGGFASATVSGIHTRRYHGLLVAATKPPVGRMLMVSKFEETLVVGEERFELSANEYSGAIHPRGFEYLAAFRLDPWPVYVYEAAGVKVEKSIFMAHDRNTTVVSYNVVNAPKNVEVRLELRPLIAGRDYHSTTHENGSISRCYELFPNLVSMVPYDGLPRLYFAHNATSVEESGNWYRNFIYRVEQERGLDYLEDLFNPFVLNFSLKKSSSANVILSTSPVKVSEYDSLRREEGMRRSSIAAASMVDDDFVRQLTVATDQFIAKRDEGFTLMAGYPWFTDWGRDTMIALPGLTLYNGRADVAKGILRTFAQYVDQGMLPNRFPDLGEQPEFNTVDATLWYFEAARAYAAATDDYDFVRRELYSVLQSIIDWHIKGTRYGIQMLDNGMLSAGEPGVQLTWMDAKIDNWVVTPRSGKPVEIQALWYNALRIMEDFATRFGDQPNTKRYRTIATVLQWTFNRVFWNEKGGYLYDCINGGPPDASIRPNQIIAISLPHSMLTRERTESVIKVVERELLTPFGLRTLSPMDPKYSGHYGGDSFQRDSVYHQGTIWPWLLGPYITAYMKGNGDSADSRGHILSLLEPLKQHLSEAGLGQISEVLDGDAPHKPGGCFAQAWSVGEILRALCENVYRVGAKDLRAAKASA
ncbi:MAG TPA: amylo-alpha-1,6-glucosidase [Terriglobales bacterium]